MQRNERFTEERRTRQIRYFSSDFKIKRIWELENNLVKIADICRTHKVSRSSVYKWLYKYSTMAKKQVRQVIEAKSDTKKIELLNERVRELERVVGQKQLLIDFQDKMIELAEQTYSVDIKKKLGSTPCSGIGKKGKCGLGK